MPSCPTHMSTTCIPDAVIAIAASKNSRALTKDIYGDEIGWLPWKRPGFELGLWLEKFARENPEATRLRARKPWAFHLGERCEVLLRADARRDQPRHRLVRARDRPASRSSAELWSRRFRAKTRRAFAARLMPEIRHLIGNDEPKIGHFDDSDAVLEFVGVEASRRARSARHVVPGSFSPNQDLAAGDPPEGWRRRQRSRRA